MTDPDRLIDRYLDGKLTPEEWQQLERDLKHPRYADRFAEAMLVDSLMHERYERDAITTSLRLGDGSFMGEQDLAVLMADYNNAEAELVDLSRLAQEARRKGAELNAGRAPVDPMPPREVVSIIGYLAMCGLVRGLKTPAGMAISAAAVLLLGVALFFALSGNPQAPATPSPTASPTPTPRAPAVATLTNTHNAQWGGAASAAPTTGDNLHPNTRLTLTHGFAEITTARGAIALLEAPATIELSHNKNALYLETGKLVGICETDASKGFTVRTPHMDITDLGTRFGVDATEPGVTEAHVFEGEVTVAPPRAGNHHRQRRTPRLTQGMAVRARAYGEVVAIAHAPDRFTQRPGVYRLFGTGYQRDEGVIDPNWHIVADGKGPLESPVPLIVQYGEQEGDHFHAPINDPDRARSLIYAPNYPLYARHDQPELDTRLLTLRSRFDIDQAIDLQGLALYLEYHTPGLGELRINGQPVEPLPKIVNRGELLGIAHKAEVPLDTTALRHGENVIEIDLPNPRAGTQAPPYISVYAELRPRTRSQTPKGETQP